MLSQVRLANRVGAAATSRPAALPLRGGGGSSSSSGAPKAQAQQQAPAFQQQQQARAGIVARAKRDDDEMFDRMAKEADAGSDIWSSEIVATGLKIALVALFVTVTIILLDVAQPIVQTTVERFPSPQDYQ